jgi:CPA2 family monovalent cation:H+ antiporter-2
VSLGGAVSAGPASQTLIDGMFDKSDSVLAFTVRQAGMVDSIPVLVAETLVNVAALVALLPLLGRLVSALLEVIDRSESDEMLTLAAVVIALFLSLLMATTFGVSVALAAFFAGIIVSASRLAHRITEEIRPLRNLFGVLFFASVGMLLDPMTVVRMPLHVLAVVLIIVVAKPAIAAGIALVLGQSSSTAITIGAGLAQIGEFSFILGTLGRSLGLLPEEAYQLIIAGAIISIALNPVVFLVSERIGARWATASAHPALVTVATADIPAQVGARQSA